MLSVRPEEELLRRDSALQGLRILLDGEAMHGALRAAWACQAPASLACHYLRYKPGVNCLAGYTANAGSAVQYFYAKAYTRAQYQRARATATVESQSDVECWMDEACVVVRPLHMDRKLRGARRLLTPERRLAFLDKILPQGGSAPEAAPTIVRYKPERRLVAALQRDSGERTLIKIYGQEEFKSAYQGAGVFRGGQTLCVPSLLGRSRRHRTLALEWLTGDPLDSLLVGANVSKLRLGGVGRALAELHAQHATSLEPMSPERYGLSVLASANSLARILPAQAKRILTLAAKVVVDVLDQPAILQPIHGDFNPEQVLMGEERVGIIDFDRAARGDPAIDVGGFLAWLEYDQIRGRLPASESEQVAWGFIDGYAREAAALSRDAVLLHASARLIQLSSQPFRQRLAQWDVLAEAIIERAERTFFRRGQGRTLLPLGSAVLRTVQ